MTIQAGLQSGLRSGLRSGLNPGSSSGPNVATDGPGAVYVPASGADFTALGLPTPGHLWLCQDTATGAAPTIGTVTLAENATPLYQQTVSGWTRKFLGTTEATVSQRFASTSAGLNVSAGQSFAFLVYASVDIATTQRRWLGRALNGIRLNNGDTLATVHGGVSANGVETYTGATVYPWLWYRNATTDASGTMTNLEHVVGTHDESAISAVLFAFGPDASNAAATARYGWAGYWVGADAETIAAKATLTALGWTVGW